MGELKLLGAQRVKALTNMLNEQEQAELKAVKIVRPKHEESVIYADEMTGKGELRIAYQQALEQAKHYAEILTEETGVFYQVKAHRNAVPYSANQPWVNAYNKSQRGNQDEHDRIKKKYADKRNALWLCETLEEAKELVGIE